MLCLHVPRYLIFFSPLDLFYLLTLLTPLRLVLLLVKELARAKKIFAGVTLATSVYPQSLLAMAIVGMFKGELKCPVTMIGFEA